MCYRPVHIHLSANGFKAFDVPCGNCPSCREQKQNDLFVRAWTEYNKVNRRVIFSTLTYNNQHLPFSLHTPEKPIYDGFGVEIDRISARYISCWSKRSVKSFLKALKERCQYYIGHDVDNVSRLITENGKRIINPVWKSHYSNLIPFKYLLVCERGHSDNYIDDHGRSRVGTARPHYHVLFFVYDDRLPTSKLLEFIDSIWTYGNVYNEMLDRTPAQVLNYVVKYITKDSQEPTLNSIGINPDAHNDSKPFNLISKEFGLSLIDYSLDQFYHFYNNGITIPTSNPKKPRSVTLPRYYLKRFTSYTIHKPDEVRFYKKYPLEFYNDGLSSTYVDYRDFEGLHLAKCSCTVLTEVGKNVQRLNQNRKTLFYSRYLQLVKNSPSYVSSVLSSKHFEFLRDIDIDTFKTYIHDEHYIKYDQFGSDNKYTVALNYLKQLLVHSSIQNRTNRELHYKQNLYSNISDKPELFSLFPVSYKQFEQLPQDFSIDSFGFKIDSA